MCCDNKLDVLCISEHCLVDGEIQFYHTIFDLVLTSYFCRPDITGGGVADVVKSCYSFRLFDLSEFCVESQAEFAGVVIIELSLMVVSMYCPPPPRVMLQDFFCLLELCLNYLIPLGYPVVIGTDHNINVGPDRFSAEAADFLNLLRSFNMYSLVWIPNRLNSSLDSFLTNLYSWDYSVAVSKDKIHVADHKHVFMVLIGGLEPKKSATVISFRQFSDINFHSFIVQLYGLLGYWFNCIRVIPADDSFSFFFESFRRHFDIHFPLRKKVVIASRDSDWLDRTRPNSKCMSTHWYTVEQIRKTLFL